MKEIWKDVVGYEGLYQVSNMGRVSSVKRECVYFKNGNRVVARLKKKLLTPSLTKKGYHVVGLSRDRLNLIFIHKIVMTTFVGPNNGLEIDHLNQNKTDNRLSNLEYVTTRENICRYRKNSQSSSEYVGVSKIQYSNKWRARIFIKGAHVYLGRFNTEQEAASAYDNKLKSLQQ